MTISRPAMRYHGGKWRLASWVLSHFPPHDCYVESFGGAASVLIQKPPSHAEVYNDLDGDIANFFAVLRNPQTRLQLVEAITLTPYSRDEFNQAWEQAACPVERARRTAIRAEMGFGSAGATKGKTGFRCDTKRPCSTAQRLWAAYPSILASIGQRFSGVLVENRDALQVMKAHDGPETLHFVDPPYMHSTRTSGSEHGRYYRHELDSSEHQKLIECLRQLSGMVLLCGYATPLYSDMLTGWVLKQKSSPISAHRGTSVRTECLWINPAAQAALGDAVGLFNGIAA
jgi:DNA adenine methylase